MKPEEFEVYVIPPNFMEGGTLFGGLLKTRNTIEAVILGLAVGVPVLHLPFPLTVRVVILCLTALPLVLLALIGVSGMSLSAFIRLFFCFLHNRRILSRDGTQGGKNGKTLLPSWAQQRKSDCEAEDPPLPKSRSRFSVDLKQRSVTQFKTFLQEEEAVQPLNALADYIPIEKIEHGVIYTRDHRYVKVVEVVPVNFLLRSAREQRSIIYSFISYLKIAPVKVQFKALTKRADINRHLDTVRRELEHEQDPRCRVLQEDYLKLIRQLGSREAITRRFFLVFEYEPLPGTKRGHEEEDAIASLQTAARTAANYLRQCGNEVISPENEDDATAEILYILTQPDAHSYFLLDGSFPHFYYLTNDRYGEAILRLLCDTQQRRTLDAILADGLHEGIPNWRVENDAIDSEGNPVLFAYTCDFPRIRRFDTALELHGMTGTLICFDYQEEALREICGQCVMLQSIDFQQFERSVLYS